MGIIYHICIKDEYFNAVASGEYRNETLEKLGHIHCATIEQIEGLANSYYKARSDLYLLVIDDSKVKAEIRYEGKYQGYLYPYLHGELNMDAVVKAEELKPEAGGTFSIKDS